MGVCEGWQHVCPTRFQVGEGRATRAATSASAALVTSAAQEKEWMRHGALWAEYNKQWGTRGTLSIHHLDSQLHIPTSSYHIKISSCL